MKLNKIAIALLGPMAMLAALCAFSGHVPETAHGSSVLGVRTYMKNVSGHPCTVEIEGVVSRVMSGRNMVALIDTQEYEECRVVSCAQLQLPVFWEGELPAVYDVVRVKGAVGERDDKRLFVAEELTKVGRVDAKE
jgi:hypothetical protein